MNPPNLDDYIAEYKDAFDDPELDYYAALLAFSFAVISYITYPVARAITNPADMDFEAFTVCKNFIFTMFDSFSKEIKESYEFACYKAYIEMIELLYHEFTKLTNEFPFVSSVFEKRSLHE